MKIASMLTKKEICLAIVLEGRPVAADDAVLGNDGLEDAAVVVGMVAVFWGEDDVARLITNKVFVVRRNQKVIALAETTGATVFSKVIFTALPFLCMDVVAKEHDTPFAIADT